MYLFPLIKSDLIANDFSIERHKDIQMNTRAPVYTFPLCNLLKCVVSSNSDETTKLRCGCAPSKMMKTSSLIGTRGAKMTTNSLMKACKVARDHSLFDNVVKQTHVGRYGKRAVNVSSAWSYNATDSLA